MATITVKDLIKSLEKCDPNAIVVGHVEDKEYTFAIEVIEQFSREEIVETAQRECENAKAKMSSILTTLIIPSTTV